MVIVPTISQGETGSADMKHNTLFKPEGMKKDKHSRKGSGLGTPSRHDPNQLLAGLKVHNTNPHTKKKEDK